MFWAGATPWLAALGLLSVWWRGLAFGAVHVYQGLSGMVATGLTGLVLAGVYVGTGRNLWAASATHGVLDTAGFVLIYLGLYPGIT